MNLDGIFDCKVVEIIPFEKLSYSWKGGPGNGMMELDSVVVWTLHLKDKGTEIFLEHSGFREIEDFTLYSSMNEGWLKNTQKIADLINAG